MKETIMVTASGVALELVDGHFQSENMEEVIMQQIQNRIGISIKISAKC